MTKKKKNLILTCIWSQKFNAHRGGWYSPPTHPLSGSDVTLVVDLNTSSCRNLPTSLFSTGPRGGVRVGLVFEKNPRNI